MGKTKILIYDSIANGHHLDYLFYVMQQASLRKNIELVLVCSTKIDKNLNDFSFPVGKFPTIQFDYLSEEQLQAFHQKPIFLRSIAEWNYAVQLAEKHEAQQILFPYFDYFQLGALVGKTPQAKVSGILFRGNTVNKMYGSVKKTALKWVLRKPFFDKLFVLTEDIVEDVKNLTSTEQVVYLPDPVYQFPSDEVSKKAFVKNLSIESSKTVFLNFGYLDSRKGIVEFLEACQLLDSSIKQKIHLVLAGKMEASLQPKVEKLLANLPEISCSKLFSYHLPQEAQHLFELTDWTLVLYPKFLGSSSVLIRSAMANKPVLGGNIGTIGAQMRRNTLGISIDPENRKEIANALTEILTQNIQPQAKGLKEFSEIHSINNFGNILFENM
ncbi:MAG: hypothetical protein RI995_588 [Bacteroidota bacterium]